VQPARNHWQGALGASFDLTPQASLYAYYSVDTATHVTSNAANLGFRWSFSKPPVGAAFGMGPEHMPASTTASPAVAALGAYPAVAPATGQAAVSPAAAAVLPAAVATHSATEPAAAAAGAGAAEPADVAAAETAAPFGRCKNHIVALGGAKTGHAVAHHHLAGTTVGTAHATTPRHVAHGVAKSKSVVSCSG
jgi:fibronectin-binding autotransporter adhesin